MSLLTRQRRDTTQLFGSTTLKELKKNYPSVPWKEYFARLLPPTITVAEDEEVIIPVPSYFTKLETLMSQTPKRVQANYVMWHAASSSVRYLNEPIRKKEIEMLSVLYGSREREVRWQECVHIVSDSLSISVGSMYVKKYFTEDAKLNVVQMVMDIRKELRKILESVDSMDEKTRRSALVKAEAMTSHIGHPDELLDDDKLDQFYKNLEFSEDSYLENSLNFSRFAYEYWFQSLRKPVKKADWVSLGSSAVVNAFYSSTENSIQFPAGILQGTFFSNDRPQYMNYGAIGSVIGHEIIHGFDNPGSQFDENGNRIEWWSSSTKEKFLQRARCIVDQYSNYTVQEGGFKLNGVMTQSENIADHGGIKEAYLAYNSWVARNGEEKKLPGVGRTPKQLFWISHANMRCSISTPEVVKLLGTLDPHAPAEFRIIGPLSNMPEFARDFMCPEGSKMNPKNKCSLW